MSLEKAEGLVIRQADFSESSRVLTFFTREFGKVAMLAKGAKRVKGPFQSALDLLSACRIVFIRKHSASLDLLTEAQLIRRFQPAPGELTSLYGGYYVAELLDSLSEAYDPAPVLYDAAQGCLARLSLGGNVWGTLMQFELIVLRELGQLPEFENCVACEGPLPTTGQVAFKVSQGGFLCQKCEGDQALVSHFCDARLPRLLAELAEHDLSAAPPEIEVSQLAALRRVLVGCISQILGRKPATLRYLPL